MRSVFICKRPVWWLLFFWRLPECLLVEFFQDAGLTFGIRALSHLAVAPKSGIPSWVALVSGNMGTKTCGLPLLNLDCLVPFWDTRVDLWFFKGSGCPAPKTAKPRALQRQATGSEANELSISVAQLLVLGERGHFGPE